MITALIVVVLVVALVVLLAWIIGAIIAPDPTPSPPPRGIPDDPPTLVMQWPVVGFPRDEPDRVRPYIAAYETGDRWAAFRGAA